MTKKSPKKSGGLEGEFDDVGGSRCHLDDFHTQAVTEEFPALRESRNRS